MFFGGFFMFFDGFLEVLKVKYLKTSKKHPFVTPGNLSFLIDFCPCLASCLSMYQLLCGGWLSRFAFPDLLPSTSCC